MAFFSTVRGLPILDHVILFCRLVLGAYRVSSAGPTTLCTHTHCTGQTALLLKLASVYSFIVSVKVDG